MVRGITIYNIEAFNKYTEALKRLDIQLILANYKKLKVTRNKNIWYFYKRGKSFGYVTDNNPVYELDITQVTHRQRDALEVAFFKSEDTEYDLKLTATIGEEVFVALPTVCKETDNFKLNSTEIKYGKVVEISGNDEIYPLVTLELYGNNMHKYVSGIPCVLCYKDIEKLIEACKRTPKLGYTDIRNYTELCGDLINYTHQIWFGYAYKSRTPFGVVKGYKSSKYTYTYNIDYTTDDMRAYTYTLPTAINLYTKEVYNEITVCRADSISKDSEGNDIINISIDDEKVAIIREKVKSAFEINKIE